MSVFVATSTFLRIAYNCLAKHAHIDGGPSKDLPRVLDESPAGQKRRQ